MLVIAIISKTRLNRCCLQAYTWFLLWLKGWWRCLGIHSLHTMLFVSPSVFARSGPVYMETLLTGTIVFTLTGQFICRYVSTHTVSDHSNSEALYSSSMAELYVGVWACFCLGVNGLCSLRSSSKQLTLLDPEVQCSVSTKGPDQRLLRYGQSWGLGCGSSSSLISNPPFPPRQPYA